MNSKVYLYDGTYDNFMQLVAKLLSLKIKPLKIVAVDKYVPSLFEDAINLDVDNYLKNKLIVKLSNKIKKEVFKVYLSENEDKELIIYYFILNSLKYGNEVFKMRNLRSYYSASIAEFLQQSSSEIIGIIHSNDISAETAIQQSNTWESEVQILKDQLRSFSDGRIIFEYTIPRMGKRVDAVVLYKNIVFLLEFKCGDTEYRQSTYDQVYDYALDLRNFQKESHDKLLVPIMVSTRAATITNVIRERDRVIEPLRCNAGNIADMISRVAAHYNESAFNYVAWENSEYLPTPTIV